MVLADCYQGWKEFCLHSTRLAQLLGLPASVYNSFFFSLKHQAPTHAKRDKAKQTS